METLSLADGAVLRPARPGDVEGILDCVRGLARYEREPDAVRTTVDDLHAALFGPAPAVFAHVVERDGEIVGIAVWFLNYSTWTGRHGIYLEDLFVREDQRGRGYGRALVTTLARRCVERGYARLNWAVLDWNTPALDFYDSLGARPLPEWVGHVLTGDRLTALGTP
ncbi:GNAT family N-acetyltransferase [Protofrankia coriariae]|uniref:GCN5 family acetyltransferase n=1 Tax=Protofrankia coriariae TaxID=1562887 RepID=A0ABR5F4R8_9ACTN|nr:GNAT family N-acetyltransferase [Protofrankia coriariae]KLL11674.1 GCN5 family acetyltransferase [Protofrankia coriariae]